MTSTEPSKETEAMLALAKRVALSKRFILAPGMRVIPANCYDDKNGFRVVDIQVDRHTFIGASDRMDELPGLHNVLKIDVVPDLWDACTAGALLWLLRSFFRELPSSEHNRITVDIFEAVHPDAQSTHVDLENQFLQSSYGGAADSLGESVAHALLQLWTQHPDVE